MVTERCREYLSAGAPTRGTRPAPSLTLATSAGQGQAVKCISLARGKRNPCGPRRTSKKRWRHKLGVGEGGFGGEMLLVHKIMA